MEKDKPAICVFCGSSFGDDPVYAEVARSFGTLLGRGGYDLVFGGGYVGLMGEVARAAQLAGAGIMGVLPEFLRHLEPPAAEREKVVLAPDLQARKRLMLEAADGFVALPGGPGTLDEFLEVITSAQLGQIAGPIVLLDVNNFFAPLIILLDHVIAKGFAHVSLNVHYRRAATPEEAIAFIDEGLDHATSQ